MQHYAVQLFQINNAAFCYEKSEGIFIQNANDKLNSTAELKSVINQLISIIYH